MDLNKILNFDEKRKIEQIDDDDDQIKDHSGIKKKKSFSFTMSLFTFLKENHPDNNQEELPGSVMGLFDLLPEEIFVKILKFLTIEELSVMTLVNNKFRNFIIHNFLINYSGFNYLIRANQFEADLKNSPKYLQLFSSIGLLLKRSTFLFCTNERINFLIQVLENSYGIPSIKLFNNFDYQSFKTIMKCYGKIINRLISGWGDFECENVFQKLKEISQIDSHVQKFLNSSLGSKQKQELLIRNFFRMICGHNNESLQNFKEKLCWLINTLNVYSEQEIAKLFIVIFGPIVTINNGFYSPIPYVAWWDLTDSNFTEKGLEDLGLTFHFLYKKIGNSIWTKDHVIRILECTFTTPAIWTFSNCSVLLYYAGYDLTLKFFNKKMKDGKVHEVASYICYLNIITYKLYHDLSSILKLIDFLIEDHGYELIEEIIQAFSNIIQDLDFFNDEEEGDLFEQTDVIESQLELMKLSFLRYNYTVKD